MAVEFGEKPSFGGGASFGSGPKFSKASDPLKDVEITGNIAEDSARELTAMETAYRDRAKAESERFKNATDSEFWFAVCFKTRAEKEAFIQAIGAAKLGDKYIDGHKLAKLLEVEL